MDVLVSYQARVLGELITHVLSHEPSVDRADFAVGGDEVLAAVSLRRYDLHLIGEASISTCRAVTKRVVNEHLEIHAPVRRVLIGEAPSALSVANAIWLGFDGVIDLHSIEGAMGAALLTPSVTPIEYCRLSDTGWPIVGICHDKTDIRILAGIVEGLTDPEIADRLHYAVQSIRNRVSRILAESGARNRTHLAALFLQHGGASGR